MQDKNRQKNTDDETSSSSNQSEEELTISDNENGDQKNIEDKQALASEIIPIFQESSG